MNWPTIEAGELMARRNGSVNPANYPEEIFELHSIPAFDAGKPEVTLGKNIGSSKQIIQPNDVMISKIVPHIRRASVVGKASNYRQIASGEWIVFRSPLIHPDFLRHFLVCNQFNAQFMATVSGVGGSLLRARPAEVAKIKIPLPPLPEQHRIAAILDKAEALRSKRREAISKLDQLLQSVFLEMFGDPVTNSKNWPLKSFLEVGQWKSGATPSKSNSDYWIGSYPWVSPKDMKVDHIDDSQDHLNEEVFAKTSLKKIDPNHILIVVRGMILAHSFPVAINNVSIAINQDMKAIEPNSDFSSKYLISCIKSLKQRFLSVVSSAGHGTKRLDLRDAAEISIPMPDISLQKKFDDIYDKVKIQKKNLIQQETKLQDFISSIQYKYFQ